MNTALNIYYTLEDLQQWKGDWELIDGHAVAMSPSPHPVHQYISGKIFRLLDEQLDACEESCYVLFEVDWFISNDTLVRPDVIVVCDELQDKITNAPEIIFEIVSEKNSRTDEVYKFDLYCREGAKYYVLCYPFLKKAKIYKLKEDKYIKQGDFRDDVFSFDIKCRLDLDFSKIWFK
jgi:Uma2 family endonuclease